jgi:hypothetical protein
MSNVDYNNIEVMINSLSDQLTNEQICFIWKKYHVQGNKKGIQQFRNWIMKTKLTIQKVIVHDLDLYKLYRGQSRQSVEDLYYGFSNDVADYLLYVRGVKLNDYLFSSIVEEGNLRMLKWLRDNNCPHNTDTTWEAARNGDHKTLLILLKWGHKLSDDVLRDTIHSKQFDTAKLLVKCGCVVSVGATIAAADENNLPLLKWLSTKPGFDTNWHAILAASKHGNVPMLEFLLEKGCRIHPYSASYAAKRGHFDVLKLLHKHSCKWEDGPMEAAVKFGNVEITKWLCSVGCPITFGAYKEAKKAGSTEMVKAFTETDPLNAQLYEQKWQKILHNYDLTPKTDIVSWLSSRIHQK